MRNTHIILASNNPQKLDKAIRVSRKLFTINKIVIVVPEGTKKEYAEKTGEIKKTWDDVDVREASVEDFQLCALDICDIIAELLSKKKEKGNEQDIIINIAFANSTFAGAGLFVASILKKKIISDVNNEPAELSAVPFQELIAAHYAILRTIPLGVCNQRKLEGLINANENAGLLKKLKLEPFSPTNLSYHLKRLDDMEFIVRVSKGRDKEVVLSNLGWLMRASFEFLHPELDLGYSFL
jgi:hypothetical protein